MWRSNNSGYYSDSSSGYGINGTEECCNDEESQKQTVIAVDCEFVGDHNNHDMIGRVSIVNEDFQTIYDEYVVYRTRHVGDYRTWISGITEYDLMNGIDFLDMRAQVNEIFDQAHIIVGHAIDKDIRLLGLPRPRKIRDTAKFPLFQSRDGGRSLKWLARKFLNRSIQNGPHDSVEDASTCMALYSNYHIYEQLHATGLLVIPNI